MSNHLKRAIADFLATNAFTDIVFDRVGKHRRARATYQGIRASIRFSSTPSDSFYAQKKAIADIRRAFALPAHSLRGGKRSANVRNHAGAAARPVLPHVVAAPARRREDFREVLAALLRTEGA